MIRHSSMVPRCERKYSVEKTERQRASDKSITEFKGSNATSVQPPRDLAKWMNNNKSLKAKKDITKPDIIFLQPERESQTEMRISSSGQDYSSPYSRLEPNTLKAIITFSSFVFKSRKVYKNITEMQCDGRCK